MTYTETLEEAAEKYAEIYRCPATNENEYCKHDIISAFNKGAKWNAERSYSEADMQEYAKFCLVRDREGMAWIAVRHWFEKYKMKP